MESNVSIEMAAREDRGRNQPAQWKLGGGGAGQGQARHQGGLPLNEVEPHAEKVKVDETPWTRRNSV